LDYLLNHLFVFQKEKVSFFIKNKNQKKSIGVEKVRILLIALNARYVHTNLAIRYLREILEGQGRANWEVQLKEFSINEHLENMAAEIYEEKPDIIGFSCYIWNISQILALIRRLRPVLPQTYFLTGGPEVSFNPEELLARYPELDAIVVGEGEYSVPDLVQTWSVGELPWEVKGIVWHFAKPMEERNLKFIIPAHYQGQFRDEGSFVIFSNERSVGLPDLNRLPDPYAKEENFKGRLVYMETSRGCPFSCEFCISSTFRGIRYLDPERFRLSLRQLFNHGARTIKFVDRTFNARKKHAFRILDVFREEAERILAEEQRPNGILPEDQVLPRAHCEMAGELLDEEWLEYLQAFPRGMLQLEIGVQSTHQPTLDAVNRHQNFAHWQEKVKFLQHTCKIPVHLDLIAGLPLEGWQEFRGSFNVVFEVRPNNLQLGFLKVLQGSGIREKSAEYGLVYSPDPPYTILQTGELTHGEMLALARVEEILEKYYNSERFKYSLEYILREEQSPFDFFHSLADYWGEKGWFRREWNPKALFENLWKFIQEENIPNKKIKGYYMIEENNGKKEKNQEEYRGKNEIKKVKVARSLEDIWREALRFDYYLLERPGQIPAFLQGQYSGLTSAKDRYKNQLMKEIDRKRAEIKNDPCWPEFIPEAKDLDKRQWSRATAVEYFALDIPNYDDSESGAWYLFYYRGSRKQYFKYRESNLITK
jgi:anaerobic magnesium-protoporphyrin IX monomethyl ester cyclase